jgi:hypothetical protein
LSGQSGIVYETHPGGGVSQHRRFHSALDRAFDYFLFAFIFVTVFLPSGTVYGINFKSPLYVALLPLAAYSIFHRGQASIVRIVMTLGIPLLLVCWFVLGVYNGFALVTAWRQLDEILLTLLMCWLALIFCGQQEENQLRFLRVVLNSVLAAAVLKLGLIAYAIIHGIPVVVMVALVSKAFGAELQTMDLGSLLGRVQFISDELIPVSIFILLRHRDVLKIGSLRASVTIIALLASVIFSFSRYFWAFAAVALVLGLLLGKRDRFQAILLVVLGFSVLATLPSLTVLYKLRFSTDVAGSSDAARKEQIPALKNFFMRAPLFGNGLGSYTKQVVRGETIDNFYSYEVQILALPAQVGIIGMTLLVFLAGFYYSKLWWKSSLSFPDRIGVGFMLGIWIAAGFSNPLLIHPLAGVNYAALAMLAEIKSERSSPTPEALLSERAL